MDECTSVPLYVMHPGERVPVQIDWHDWLIRHREPGVSVALDEVIRPPRNLATGFQYRCTAAGVTSAVPFFRLRWPHEVGANLVDGSVQWTTEAIDDQSLRTTIAAENWVVTEGLTLSQLSAGDSIYHAQVETTTATGTSGQEFMVSHRAEFLNGEKRRQSIQLNVEA